MDSPTENANLQHVKIELTNTQVSEIISDYIEKAWGFKVVQPPYIKENYQRVNRDQFVYNDDSCFCVVSNISIERIQKQPSINPFSALDRVLTSEENV